MRARPVCNEAGLLPKRTAGLVLLLFYIDACNAAANGLTAASNGRREVGRWLARPLCAAAQHKPAWNRNGPDC